MKRDDFIGILTSSLSTASPIRSPEYLRGRDKALATLVDALSMPGRQAFIHGFRGVGKTSLAETAASQIQSSDAQPLRITCGNDTTFASLARDVHSQTKRSGGLAQRTTKTEFGFDLKVLKANTSRQTVTDNAANPTSINEAVDIFCQVGESHSRHPVVIIDEFDAISDENSKRAITLLIKGISDRGANIRLIMCGIGETLESLLSSHGSAHRFLHTVKLDRLDYESCLDIVLGPMQGLEVNIDDTTKYRIARVSDGFPYYVHLQTEKTLWAWFHRGANGPVLPEDYVSGIREAAESIGPELREPYAKIAKKYKADGEHILWAMADNHQLERQLKDVYDNYLRLCQRFGFEELNYNQFSTRMSMFTKDQYDNILVNKRRSWYEYREKMMRGYARLVAEERGVELDADHPKVRRQRLPSVLG